MLKQVLPLLTQQSYNASQHMDGPAQLQQDEVEHLPLQVLTPTQPLDEQTRMPLPMTQCQPTTSVLILQHSLLRCHPKVCEKSQLFLGFYLVNLSWFTSIW